MARAWDVNGLAHNPGFGDAAGRIVLTRWREMISYRDGTLAGDDIEELHAMRVSSRRLRAAMDAFADVFPAASFRRYLREVKRITDTLGDARDLDVAIDHLTILLPEMDGVDRPGIEGLIDRYEQQRRAEDARIRALFDRLDGDHFAERFEAWVHKHTGIDVVALAPSPPAGA
jgi:CHAD domain-containing protein